MPCSPRTYVLLLFALLVTAGCRHQEDLEKAQDAKKKMQGVERIETLKAKLREPDPNHHAQVRQELIQITENMLKELEELPKKDKTSKVRDKMKDRLQNLLRIYRSDELWKKYVEKIQNSTKK
ncbi:MAG: hypothetical protein Tsb009_27770 [Planctomycetaceae bacterium]